MRQSKILMGLFALLIAFSIVSCKDDEATKSRTDLLTQHSWKVKSGTPADHVIVKIAIEAGIEYTFRKDGTLTAIDHRVDEPINGRWRFNSDETEIITSDVDGTGSEQTSVISLLDDANLEFENSSGTQIVTVLFVKK
jgi:hypothetical protein